MQKKIEKIGLTLGKFAPLHKGHQYLIEEALKIVDELIVVIYNCPDKIDVPLNTRAGWIKKLYPMVRVIEAWDGPSEAGKNPRIMKLQEDYIKSIIKKRVTHFFSSEWYGLHMSKALGAENIVVDKKRINYKISGRTIRKNLEKNRKFLHPLVYKDMIKKIVFLGAESTGKSTITKELAKRYQTKYMSEYGREYWEKNNVNKRLTLAQLAELAEEHIKREEELLSKSNKYLFVDTNAITTEMFSIYYHGKVHKKLKKMAKESKERYDTFFVCDVDIPYVEDGTRSGPEHRLKFQKKILADLDNRRIKYHVLSGTIEERIKQVEKLI